MRDVYARRRLDRAHRACQEATWATPVRHRETVAGAGAVTAAPTPAAKAAPDGYTLLLMSNAHTVNETLIPNKPYALRRDFVPVAPINHSDLMLRRATRP